MRIGVIFPQLEIGGDPTTMRDYAQTVESLGFSHLVAFDHVLGVEHDGRMHRLWGPSTEYDTFHEPFTLFAFLSGLTEQIGFVTGVLVLPQRQTALVAKQAAEVDILSAGRLRLGIGVGWNYVEYAALGESFNDRGARQEEQVEVLRALWREPTIDYVGRWHTIERAGILPRPNRSIPIWFGGSSKVSRERAARIGDGFIFSRGLAKRSLPGELEAIKETIELGQELRERARKHGRDGKEFGLEARLAYRDGPASWTKEVAALRVAGFDFAAVNTMKAGLTTPRAHFEAIERLGRELDLSDDS